MADRTSSPRARSPQLPIHRLSYTRLLITPILLAGVFTALAVALALHDVNTGLLYSQCHARARIPFLSRIPVLGAPACFLVSFLSSAVASSRAVAIFASSLLSLLAGLLTVSGIEASRLCNASAPLLAHPTGSWLVFVLGGGPLVWALVVVPASLRRGKRLAPLLLLLDDDDQNDVEEARRLAFAADVVAVPLSVALGFGIPSAALLATRGMPAAVMAWLLFPVAVAAVRRATRWVLLRARPETSAPSLRLEASRRALLAVYGLPVLFSASAHVWGLVVAVFGGAGRDDRREMTRSTLRFIELDSVFVGLTVLYWVLVEGGWRPAAVMALVSAVLGPGAGVCAAWVWREWTAHSAGLGADGEHVEGRQDDENPEREGAAEDTPLLR